MPTDDSRHALLKAATQAFAEKGFAGARVDQIAARAKVNKAMIYYHFRTKDGLFAAVLVAMFTQAYSDLAEVARSEGDPARRVVALYEAFAALLARRPPFAQIMLHELASGGRHLNPSAMQALGSVFGLLLGALQEGISAGVFRPVNPLFVHLSLAGTLVVYSVTDKFRKRMRAANPGLRMPPDDAEGLLRHVRELLARMLFTDSKPTDRS